MITYLDLLLLIKEGKQPNAVKLGNRLYRWEIDDRSYRSGQFFLSEAVSESFFDIDLVSEQCIEIIQE